MSSPKESPERAFLVWLDGPLFPVGTSVRFHERQIEYTRHDICEGLAKALRDASRIAGEAEAEWDAAPQGMKAGKLPLALSSHLPKYRVDIDAVHAALARFEALK